MQTPPNAEPKFQLGDSLADDKTERFGFNEKGVSISPDSPECVAKKSMDAVSGNTRYFVKVAKTGSDAGRFYNPQSSFTKPKSLNSRGSAGLEAYLWRPVRADAFDSYLRFLTTGNILCLRNAERL